MNPRSILAITLVAGLLSACDNGPTPTQSQPSQTQPDNRPAISVRDTGTGLDVTNDSGEPLTIRAAFVIPTGPGVVGVCNPYGPPGNQSVPLPEDPSSPYDQLLLPALTIRVPSSSCPNYTGYSIWARNGDGELVFEQHR